jgi:predicted nucleic acid-binding protein
MILVDANIPMYLVGGEHPNKHRAVALVENALAANERLVTDAEVVQEILHRYTALSRPEAIQPALDFLLTTVDETFPVEAQDVLAAKDVLLGTRGLSARDAVHIAVMRRREVPMIMSFDRGFDRDRGISRRS